MSYILQALAQSERERRNADAPDLERIFDIETPIKPGRRRRTLIIVVLLVNVAVIATLLLLGDFQFGDKSSTPAATVSKVTPLSTTETKGIPAAQQETTLSSPSPTPESSLPIYNTPANDAATQNMSIEELPIESIDKKPTPHVFLKDLPITEPVTETPVTQTESELKPDPIDPGLAKAVNQQHEKIVGITGLERVRTLPGIDMSVHAYSEKIAERFVYINGQEYHEGDKISADGTKLEAITPDGIVVDLGGQRVFLNRIR